MKIFISYSHKNRDFADKLVRDLNFSDVPATYDKWLLNVGDSIIQKISEFVQAADQVIAILSKDSVDSNWVKKELAIAMTGEIENKKIKVLPIVIDNCNLPAMLSDKLYVNFNWGYFRGLQELVRSINPILENRYIDYYGRRSQQENNLSILKDYILSNRIDKIKEHLIKNDFFLAALLGHLWTVSESIPDFRFIKDSNPIDFVVVNGQSFRYKIALTSLMNVDFSNETMEQLKVELERLIKLRKICYQFEKDFRTAVAIRMKKECGAEQICDFEYIKEKRMSIKIKLICGRRNKLTREINEMRNSIYESSNEEIEIITYDRLIESIEKSFER
jgi:hypothetical protein